MKKLISIAIIMGMFGTATAAEWKDEALEQLLTIEDETSVDYINENMMWADDEEFQAVNDFEGFVLVDKETSKNNIENIDANMLWADDKEFQAIN